MKNRIISFVIMVSLMAGAFGVFGGITENVSASTIPEYNGGYGYDNETGIMEGTNGFRYSYQSDGIVKLVLPWGYTTHFSFGLTGEYLGESEIKTALDYSWNWDIVVGECLNETGNFTGYSYSFVATNVEGNLDWTIAFDFRPDTRMKVTHTLENGYAQTLSNVEFWYLFDLRGTGTPYTIETILGITEGTLYQEIPDSVYWVRLANQFQFNWRDALADYENGYAYVGDGSVIGMDGVPILGISLEIGDIVSGDYVTVDPFFSGVELTWNAGSDGLASTPANWSPVQAPDTGDNITFDGTSVYNCDWNLEKTLGNFSMLTGYTGTVTQTVSFGVVDYTQNAGTYTGSTSFVLSCEGNFTYTGTSLTAGVLRLKMIGDDTTISVSGSGWFYGLEIDANVTLTATLNMFFGGTPYLIINADKTFTLNDSFKLFSNVAGTIFENNGIIDNGAGSFEIWLTKASQILTFGVVNSPVEIHCEATTNGDRDFSLATDTVLGSSFEIISYHASYTINFLHGTNYQLDIAGQVTLGTLSIMTQGTGAWSFGSYVQSGVSSVFNQGATVAIGTDFTVSDGIFNAVGDMTVPGDWDTATGDYVNDDNVVYLTGAAKTLAMHADDSFYNVTVSGSYTMNTDTNVRLRATISGTVDGTGDFIEPEPEFTSDGWPHACPLTLYEYTPTQTYWDTLELVDPPYWLHLIDGVVIGVPNDNDTGIYFITLTLTWNDMTTYQNYTIIVCPETLSDVDILYILFFFQILLFAICLIGYKSYPILFLFVVLGNLIIAVPTLIAFGDLYYIALILILINSVFPAIGIIRYFERKK